jgi:hypothetical protein
MERGNKNESQQTKSFLLQLMVFDSGISKLKSTAAFETLDSGDSLEHICSLRKLVFRKYASLT